MKINVLLFTIAGLLFSSIGTAQRDSLGLVTVVELLKEKQRKEITILDHFQDAASVRIEAADWVDYLHLAKFNGRWVIVNVLWERRNRQYRRADPGQLNGWWVGSAMWLALFCFQAMFVSASQGKHDSPGDVVRKYLSAQDLQSALSLLAHNHRFWFGKKEGPGMLRSALAKTLGWDFALHPQYRIDDVSINGREVVVQVHEDNDFSRLIDLPGWDSVLTFSVDETGLISSQVYVPKEEQPDWKPYLDKALPWLRRHHPRELAHIYRNNTLEYTEKAAKTWFKILREWRAATGRSYPRRKHKS